MKLLNFKVFNKKNCGKKLLMIDSPIGINKEGENQYLLLRKIIDF